MKKDSDAFALVCVILPPVVFIILLLSKLFGLYDMSWLWVTSPLWIPVAAIIVLCVIAYLIAIPFAIREKLLVKKVKEANDD